MTRQRFAKILLALILVGALVLAGVGIWHEAHDKDAAPAVQAVTSYVLLIVTTAYVALTYNLVQHQRRQARYEIETRALMELGRILHEAKRFMVPSLQWLFPLPGRGPKPDFATLARPDKQLLDLYWDLNRLTPDLPSEVRGKADEAWQKVHAASSDTVNLLWAFSKEEAASRGRTWTWQGAARFYLEEHEVGRQRDPSYWDEMVKGLRVNTAIKAIEALDDAVAKARAR